jgi:hypothetical protein
MRKATWRYLTLPLPAIAFFMAVGCSGTHIMVGNHPEYPDTYYEDRERGGGPPPWAPAHGYRAKYKYRYYPYAQVYYDAGRSLYFYFTNNTWQATASLPMQLKMSLGHDVTLEMNTDKPYRYHSDVIKQYPPGHSKNRGKGKKF